MYPFSSQLSLFSSSLPNQPLSNAMACMLGKKHANMLSHLHVNSLVGRNLQMRKLRLREPNSSLPFTQLISIQARVGKLGPSDVETSLLEVLPTSVPTYLLLYCSEAHSFNFCTFVKSLSLSLDPSFPGQQLLVP